MSALYVADSIGKSFGTSAVLKSATAWAAPGRITVIMGRNGSGKTTVLRCGLGIYSLDFGVVRYDAVRTIRPQLWQLAAAGLFYLPDRGLLGQRATFGEQLRMFAHRFEEADAREAPERLEVSHLLHSTPSQMSGGELRRAEIAVAVARQPRCLIADEPLTEVEPKDRALALSALRGLADQGCAVLLTGHEVDDLLSVADEVIWMVAGTTHGLGSPGKARQHHQFRREYLGPRA